MAPLLNIQQTDLLNDLYYEKKFFFGRDKIYQYLRTNHPEAKISRRQVMQWLKLQEVHQLHLQPQSTHPKTIKSTISKEPHKILGIDLVNMEKVRMDGMDYLLNGVDMFSRKMYSVALKNKTQQVVLDGLKKMLEQIPDLKTIRSDNGSEFVNAKMKKYLKEKGINQVLSTAGLPQSNGMIERFNGVLKKQINKAIQQDPEFNWVESLDILVDNLNNTRSRATQKTPNEIEQAWKDKQNPDSKQTMGEVYDYQVMEKSKSLAKQKFEVGDKVRYYQPNDKFKSNIWSQAIYTIEKVIKPKTMFGIYQYKLNKYKTLFKQEQLQKIEGVDKEIGDKIDKFRVSKLIKPTVQKGEPHYYVKWVGYSKATIEPRENLEKDIPKMVKQFEDKNGVEWFKDKSGRLKWKMAKK